MITLTLFSFAFKNTVGFIYTSDKSPDLVRFAYIDFWGRRVDAVMSIEDEVVPFTDLEKRMLEKLYTSLRFHNEQSNMKLIYKYGGVTDYNEFQRVFRPPPGS